VFATLEEQMIQAVFVAAQRTLIGNIVKGGWHHPKLGESVRNSVSAIFFR